MKKNGKISYISEIGRLGQRQQTLDNLQVEGMQVHSICNQTNTKNTQTFETNQINHSQHYANILTQPPIVMKFPQVKPGAVKKSIQLSPREILPQIKSIIEEKYEDVFVMPKYIKINTKVRRAISINFKKNFVQFLLVQKAGRNGDCIISNQSSVDLAKKKIKRQQVSYLNLCEDKPDEIKVQVQTILMRQNNSKWESAYDELNHYQPQLPRILLKGKSFVSNIESFGI